MITVDERDLKTKINDAVNKAKDWTCEKVNNVKQVVSDHPMESFTMACLVVPGLLRIANSAIRAHSQNQETRYNECDIYDPRTGTHYYTKRPLTNNQKLNLESEYKAGRNKGEILREMKML